MVCVCAHGSLHSLKSFSIHVIKAHGVRHGVQTQLCPLRGRQFASQRACRCHLVRNSRGNRFENHGSFGAADAAQPVTWLEPQDA